MVRRAIFSLACLLATAGAGTPLVACSPQFPVGGLPGRATEITFPNRSAGGRHEYWAPAGARMIMTAALASETAEYGHNIMGPLQDAKGLTIHISREGDSRVSCPAEVLLPEGEVFEDFAPRLADLDGDGMPEVIVVQSSLTKGARLAIYDRRARLLAATPYIGQSRRWLAPLGAADLDGDGAVEIAYIDRPHLARTLRVWRYRKGRLTEVASAPGLTNHRIGDTVITGGIRNCAEPPEIVTVNADWSRIIATRLVSGTLTSRDLGPYRAPADIAKALACP